MTRTRVVIAATFTAEPIEASLGFWMRTLGIESTLAFAPYNQVFQQLVDPVSPMATNDVGVNVLLLRLEDWAGTNREDRVATVARNVEDFGKALAVAVGRTGRPHLVVCCPPSRGKGWDDATVVEQLRQSEMKLASFLASSAGVYVVSSQEVMAAYPPFDYYDPRGEEQGHIPYTTKFFAALGTLVSRKLFSVLCPPHKVIVLDCDNTLWKGVVGEDGVQGIGLDAPHKALQEYVVAQAKAGMLVCLCSKNNENDVWEVFDKRRDMVLRRDDIVLARLNWNPKSENLISLSRELSLALNSFVFLDDSAIECAEVRARCPDVLTLQVPQDPGHITSFLSHIWAFDHLKVTKEDAARTVLYKENIQRESLRQQTVSIGDFIASLGLEVGISPLEASTLARASQLTQRTNQFNTTTVRRTESELQKLSQAQDHILQVVHVKDRFGDYGLVGLVVAQERKDTLWVDNMLLSCRALGRGVEQRMLSGLAAAAQQRGLRSLELPYLPTAKNQPALDFLNSLPAELHKGAAGSQTYKLGAEEAKRVVPVAAPASSVADQPPVAAQTDAAGQRQKITAGLTLAATLRDPAELLIAVEASGVKSRRVKNPFVAPQTALEKALATIWSQTLKIDAIGTEDNFIELGGDSLQAAMCTNKIQELLGAPIYITAIFEAPTIASLAQYLNQDYAAEVQQFEGAQGDSPAEGAQQRVDDATVRRFRSSLLTLSAEEANGARRSRRTIFVLAPYRSGSTLLRVMLGGHPALFAPPELELLPFARLGERRSVLSGKYAFAVEGTTRALMELKQCGADDATAFMRSCEDANMPVAEFYALLADMLKGRVLVDKSPSYSLDADALMRAEKIIEAPFYIHLIRHPLATIRSFGDVRIDQILWKLKDDTGFSVRQLGELVWLVSHDNATRFLKNIPESRQCRIKFEDLVSNPRQAMSGLCRALNLDFSEEMLKPYADRKSRMTDGTRESSTSRMLGDPKFHQHREINTAVARTAYGKEEWDALAEETMALAQHYGYTAG